MISSLPAWGVDVHAIPARLPGGGQRLALNLLAMARTTPADLSLRAGLAGVRRGVRSHKPRAESGAAMRRLRSLSAHIAVRRAPPLEGCVQFGSQYRLPPGLPYVTLDDATIAQLRASYPYEWMQALSAAELDRLVAEQRAVYHDAQACCFVSHWAARSAVEDYGVPEHRVRVVGAGSNHPGIHPDDSKDWTRPRLLFVGKDFHRKNGPRVLAAFAELRARLPDARLDVVGGHPPLDAEGVTGHGLLRLDDARHRGILSGLYRRATCFVMPSLFEPAGYVFAEALSAGIPSIGTTRGGSATVIGDAGIVVDPEDDHALVEAMRRLTDGVEARRMHALAIDRAPLFTWTAVAGRLLAALGVSSGRPAPDPL